jgi:acetyltransferase-like isoleucine patch superfamily enzyme
MTDFVTSTRPPRGGVVVGSGAYIAESARLAVPREVTIRNWLLNPELAAPGPVSVGAKSIVLDDVVIQEGTTIGGDCFIGRSVHIGFGCRIGDSCRMEYRAEICDRVRIADGCVICGFVCDGATIGEECVVVGTLAHSVHEPDLPWGQYEADPVLEHRVFVGKGAVVVGGVTVGAGAYIAANAVVTRDVPADHVVIGRNEQVAIRDWPGELRRRQWGAGTDPTGAQRERGE